MHARAASAVSRANSVQRVLQVESFGPRCAWCGGDAVWLDHRSVPPLPKGRGSRGPNLRIRHISITAVGAKTRRPDNSQESAGERGTEKCRLASGRPR
jgi:hypothetical protein